MNTNILTILFDQEIAPYEIALFRGAVIASLNNKRLLFHNHEGTGLRYAYPLIQYKRIRQKAAIVCMAQGVEETGELFSSATFNMQLGERNINFAVENIRPQNYNIQVWETMFRYRLHNWCCLNSDNYEKFHTLEGIVERTQFLERILTGNILSMAKGIGLFFDKQVECKITSVSAPRAMRAKGVRMHCLDIEFDTNVSLPNYIGLGKHASIGFGVVAGIRDETQHGKPEPNGEQR